MLVIKLIFAFDLLCIHLSRTIRAESIAVIFYDFDFREQCPACSGSNYLLDKCLLQYWIGNHRLSWSFHICVRTAKCFQNLVSFLCGRTSGPYSSHHLCCSVASRGYFRPVEGGYPTPSTPTRILHVLSCLPHPLATCKVSSDEGDPYDDTGLPILTVASGEQEYNYSNFHLLKSRNISKISY